MPIGFNRVIIAGYLPRDVELKTSDGGDSFANFSVAVNSTWYDKRDEKHEEVSFFDCVCFSKQAESVEKYLQKGSPVLVEGKLKQDTWEDKETGDKRSKVKIICDRVQFLSSKDKDNGESERPSRDREDRGRDREESRRRPREDERPSRRERLSSRSKRRADERDPY